MRLVSFHDSKGARIGVMEGSGVLDLSAACPDLPRDMIGFLSAGKPAMDAARTAVSATAERLDPGSVTLLSPVPHPPKILAVGLNYKDHIEETGMKTPKVPIIFNKQSTAANGPYAPIFLPPESEQLDYEGELAVVIGTRCRRVPAGRASEVIAGYTIGNDVSIRDWQLRSPTQMMGKSWDSHCPLGPALVTPDECDGTAEPLKTFVNGEERQSSNTDQLVFTVPVLIEHLSTAFTLEPGDVILTGTCGGVAIAREGQPWMKVGDTVRVEIGALGFIENEVVAEPGGPQIG